MTRDLLFLRLDDIPPTHVLREKFLPPDRLVQMGGYLFVSNEIANGLGDSDAVVTIKGKQFPAWRLDGEMPA